MFGRIWHAVRFAFRALAYEWRHGPGSTLTAFDPKPDPTLVEHIIEIRRLLEERPALTTDRLVAPEIVEPPAVPEQIVPAPPAPSVSEARHPPLEMDDTPRYYVQTYTEDAAVASYAGDRGGDYRKCIEELRLEGVTFHAWMSGAPHDWGPR